MIRTPETTCAFTGHRPEKLPWGYYENDERCQALKERMWKLVQELYDRGYRHFLCGMAQGCDIYFCETVLALRCLAVGVTVEAVIPHAGQDSKWSEAQRERYERLVNMCDKRTVLAPFYDRGCMQRRNRYLVDHASLLIAAYDGSAGGTRNTIQYALQRGIPVADLPILLKNAP
jgi:uncharacterized phage-like protein YoqJ